MEEGRKSLLSGKLQSKKVWAVVFILITGAIICLGYIYYSLSASRTANTAKSESEIIQQVVSGLIDLPDEEPTMATVTDAEKLRADNNSYLFENAQNGDKVLVYSNAGKAVLFRPSTSKVIEVSKIADESSPSAVSETPPDVTATEYNYTIYNGTGVTGLAKKMEEELVRRLPQSKVVKKTNAGKDSYKESILVDLSGQGGDEAKLLAGILGLTVSGLPKGENVPDDSRFLIIVGEDKAGL